MPECEVLGDEACLRSKGSAERAEDGHEEGEHDWTIADVAEIVSGEIGASGV
jgi:hypothetical protein